ncbi:MAG: thioesterase family protein [Bacteroidales bacterium]|jgi:predicted thioesterase|nr:thioesterase family protein [Bacteroidales bacterium]
MENFKIGKEFSSKVIVNKDNVASSPYMGSGDIDVFATPAMVALMENAAMLCVADDLPDGYSTVGININTTHEKATPIGNIVTATAILTEINGRKISFKIIAFDSNGKIGEGSHQRFIIDKKKFIAKLTV